MSVWTRQTHPPYRQNGRNTRPAVLGVVVIHKPDCQPPTQNLKFGMMCPCEPDMMGEFVRVKSDGSFFAGDEIFQDDDEPPLIDEINENDAGVFRRSSDP